MDNKKLLKFYSIFFLFLAFVDLIMILSNFIGGDVQKLWNTQIDGLSVGLAHGFIIFLIGIIVLIALIKLFLGIKGLQQSNGKVSGKLHIILAKIGLFFMGIVVIFSIIDFDLRVLIDNLISFMVLFDYKKLCQKLLK